MLALRPEFSVEGLVQHQGLIDIQIPDALVDSLAGMTSQTFQTGS